MHTEYTTPAAPGQEGDSSKPQLLHDISSTGRERPWQQHHRGSLALAALYDYMAGDGTDPKAARYLALSAQVGGCAPWAEFVADSAHPQQLRLHNTSFCRARLCPMCQWRRSLKLAGQARQVVAEANRQYALGGGPVQGMAWLLLTVTVRNVPDSELGTTVDRLHQSLTRLTHRAAWPALGWLRATEVTYNNKTKMYHPHMHLLLAVAPSYFSGRSYLTKAKWVALWRAVARLDYDPVVDIRRVRPKQGHEDDPIGGAIAEVAKYGAKPSDYLRPDDVDTSAAVIGTLTDYLTGRRLTAWGGCLKQAAQALAMDDAEAGDLIHIDDTPTADPLAESAYTYILYRWSVGWGDYAELSRQADPRDSWERKAAAVQERSQARKLQSAAMRQRAGEAADLAAIISTQRTRRRR